MTTTSIGTKLGLRKITARIGAEVTGVSPSLELDPGTVTAIRAALSEHKALVFRGIGVDDGGQQRFARYFGPLTSAHPTVPAVEGEPNVLPVDSEDGRVSYWHTDVTFVLNPPQASTLRSIVIPPYGGETMIASASSAASERSGSAMAARCASRSRRSSSRRCASTMTSGSASRAAAAATSLRWNSVRSVLPYDRRDAEVRAARAPASVDSAPADPERKLGREVRLYRRHGAERLPQVGPGQRVQRLGVDEIVRCLPPP
jgi:alpha-ketoglutarate-dependent taurine dioxygenase